MNAERLGRLIDSDWALGRETGGLPRRLALELRHLITGDLLPPGTRLPPERALAQIFQVSRPTITAALDELRASGLVESRQGSGTWIGDRPRTVGPPQAMSEAVLVDHGINLAAATPADPSHVSVLVDSLLLSTRPAHGLSAEGIPELREELAAWHTAHGLPTTADDLIVTSGAHHALHLLLGALGEPGDLAVVEEHTYGGFLDLLDVAHARPVAVPRDDEGVEPDALERTIARTLPRLVYLMPSVHAPTGTATSERRRRELAAVLDRCGALVVVDETLAETAEPVPSLAALCETADVVSVHSFSKTAWGGLRVGWIRAGPAPRARLLAHRARVDLGTSVPAQYAALRIAAGFDDFATRRRRELGAKAAHLGAALSARLPGWTTAPPAGGLSLWVRLPVDDSREYARAAEGIGVAVMPGAVARPGRRDDPHVRLCFDRSAQILDEAVIRLGTAWESRTIESWSAS